VDPRVEVLSDLMEKVENTKLVDHDFTDVYLFPDLEPEVYKQQIALENGEVASTRKVEFEQLRDSTLMKLLELPTFGSIGEVFWCTKFLFSLVHQNVLWLDMAYPIHAHEIHMLTGLSMDGKDVTEAFQRPRKHGRKKGELSLYEKHGTYRGGRGVKIILIKDEKIQVACQLMTCRLMRKSNKGNAH
jgi:hypothetical protein